MFEVQSGAVPHIRLSLVSAIALLLSSWNRDEEVVVVTPSTAPASGGRARGGESDLVRLEVQVHDADAALLKEAAAALVDPGREADARAFLRQHFGVPRKSGFKALLSSAPLEGVELDRSRDAGRDIAF